MREGANLIPDEVIGARTPAIDGLPSLVAFARRATGADAIVAFEAGPDGIATPLSTDPPVKMQPFSLASTPLESSDYSQGPISADAVRLPSAIATALGKSVHRVLFMPTPIPTALRSGILFIWSYGNTAPPDLFDPSGALGQVTSLAPAFAQMLSERRSVVQKREAIARFHDLLGSVPIGIVVLESDGTTGLVNESAAELLGLAAGEHPARDIAVPMRNLRMRCGNMQALNELYTPLQGQIDYAVTTDWHIGGRIFEVDTHPILGNGRNGRIWLFNDVTAQHAVEKNLRALSVTDPLTGLNNRRYFMEQGQAAFSGSAGAGLAALMVDIDHFKKINDGYGHPAGDEVLRVVSSRMRAVLRESDLLARLGGEEFAILFGDLPEDEALGTAERLRAVIARDPIAVEAAVIEVRVSIGVALRRPEDADLDQLLARADRGLYAAKNGGRDRVVMDTI